MLLGGRWGTVVGGVETLTGDEDKNIHKRRPGKTLQMYQGAKGEARAKIREQNNVIKSAKKEGDGSLRFHFSRNGGKKKSN